MLMHRPPIALWRRGSQRQRGVSRERQWPASATSDSTLARAIPLPCVCAQSTDNKRWDVLLVSVLTKVPTMETDTHRRRRTSA